MKITIKAKPEEIAALVVASQEQRDDGKNYAPIDTKCSNHPLDELVEYLSNGIKDMITESAEKATLNPFS